MGEVNKYSGLLYCADCCSNLYCARGATIKPEKFNFFCSRYRKHMGEEKCTPHMIREVVLDEIVLEEIRKTVYSARSKTSEFVAYISKESSGEVRKELNAAGGNYSFADIECLASGAGRPEKLIDVNAKEFLAPESMTDAVRKAAGLTEEDGIGKLFAVIYYSLADKYRSEAEKLEKHLGKKIGTIHIIGGGSKDGLLNRLTAEMSGKKVVAGPTEATAIGNLTAQMLATGTFSSLSEARDCIAASFVGKEIG